MRNLSIRIAGCFLVLTALIWTLGCGPSATNSNVAQNQNANAELANTNTAQITSKACSDSGTLGDKRQRVYDEIERQIKLDGNLATQYQEEAFDFDVVIVDRYLEAHFKGLIGGEDELENLSEILNNFKEDGCLLMVRMASKSAGGGSVPPVPLSGFEWNLCEWPTYPCPDGTCACRKLGNGSGNANSNTNANANANANSNANVYRSNVNK
jgi:hypothetical protein